ncbi:hypothetical protein FRACYDRAFT_208949 [Fragilariopsis cylindrus CCMP1102]|uniref:Pentacotripeptide-repeat region of PRORP domain-containing protein n=1 Tax=Fragilariopsis cylindrus CCMP1102 TaxID=635003 RepID=A0A1E7FB92_9STRA|nr:hypothetical protein FRACYDRAFT_208949 [Fragilariopsis cylindrus CCMP1102]|eukprot:OEU15438.1 hypothetical protein FRACYDRAFT_208949 [Fragilariopsis cylindrus CCMP1102]
MVAWSRRRSTDAAMIVEQLLKRIVDEMQAGNKEVHVSTRMYSIAIKAWGKCGNVGGAERAGSIHEAMVQSYEETKNISIRPTTKSYNTLLLAWSKSKNRSALRAIEKILRDMLIDLESSTVRPDARTFSTILDFYARKGSAESVSKAETLIKSMRGLGIKKNSQVYSALQVLYLNSGRKDAPEKTMTVLQEMMSLDSQGDVIAPPDIGNYNNVLCAYSRNPTEKSALRAFDMLNRIETPLEKGGYDIEPDRLSYFLAILTCSRCPNHTLGVNQAEPLLRRMEKRSKAEKKRRIELSISAPPLVYLDIECFNVVLTAIQKSYSIDAVDRIFNIISRMEEYAENGLEHLRPNTRSMNTALNALSRSKAIDAVDRAEEILERMFQLHIGGTSFIKPDAFSYTAILRSYQRLRTPEAAQRAHDILSHMEELYETKILDEPPDVVHYTIVCSAWTLSGSKNGSQKCIEILSRMKAKDEEGWPKVKPNIRTYNAVLDSLSRSHEADKAEELLYHMLSLAKNGDNNARPDTFSFDAVINAFIHSKLKDAAEKALDILHRGKKRYLNGKLNALPSEYTYSLVIHACAFSVNADPDMKMKAFEIANDVMTELIDDGTEPSPATYGWLFQVCGRLRIPEESIKDDIERIFSRCCDKGRFSEFVLQSLKQATSDNLFTNLMTEVLENNGDIFSQKRRADTKQIIKLSHLPKDWCHDSRTETKKEESSKSKSRQRN